MDHTNTSEQNAPLTFHIRRFRQWYRSQSISQDQLMKLSGLGSRRLRSFENCRALPRPIEALLSLSIALDASMEDLIDPNLLDEYRADIEARRVELGLNYEKRDDY